MKSGKQTNILKQVLLIFKNKIKFINKQELNQSLNSNQYLR